MTLQSLAKDPNYQAYLGSLEQQYGLPTGLLATQQKRESNFNPDAVSSAGAQGVAQFMPATAQQYGIDPLDPMQASQGQARMLADLAKKYNGDIPSVLAAYNWGAGNLDRKGLANAPEETRNYVSNIMGDMSGMAPPRQDGGAIGKLASAVGNAIIPQAQAGELQSGDTAQQPSAISQLFGAQQQAMQPSSSPDLSDQDIQAELKRRGLNADTQQAQPDLSDDQIKQELAKRGLNQPEQTLGRVAGLTARAGIQGLTAIPNIIGNAANAGINLGSMGINALTGSKIPMMEYPGDITENALNKVLPQPETGIEKLANFGGQTLASFGSPGASLLTKGAGTVGDVAENAISKLFGSNSADPIPVAKETTAIATAPKKIAYEPSIPTDVSKEQRKALDILPDIVGRLTPEDIAAKLESAKELGQPMTALDAIQSEKGGVLTSGKNALGMARALANMPGETADMAGAVAQRSAQASERIGLAFDNLVSKNDFYGTLQQAQEFKDSSNPFYKNAFKQNQNMQSPVIDRILKTPAGKQALRDTAQELQNKMTLLAKPDPELTEQAKDVGLALRGGVSSGLKMKTLDLVKQKLDAMASQAFKQANMGAAPKSKGTQFSDLAKGLRQEMDSLDTTAKAGPNSVKPEGGDYAKGRARAAQGFQIEDAAQQGRDFMKSDPEEISSFIKNEDTTMPMKDAYMKGVRRSLQDTVDNISDNRNPLSSVWKQNVRNKLNAMDFDKTELDKFNKFMENEKTISRTNNHLSGGSMTNPNANYQDMVSSVGPNAKQIAKGALDPKGAAIDYGLSKLDSILQKRLSGTTQKTSKEIMKYLLTDDPKVWRGLKIKGAK